VKFSGAHRLPACADGTNLLLDDIDTVGNTETAIAAVKEIDLAVNRQTSRTVTWR
jgi:hypothetical protein